MAGKQAVAFTLTEDEIASVTKRSGGGKKRTPSAYATELKNAKLGAWYGIPATAANTAEVIARELRKGIRHMNADAGSDAVQLSVSVVPRENDPKHGNFVAWSVRTVGTETASE